MEILYILGAFAILMVVIDRLTRRIDKYPTDYKEPFKTSNLSKYSTINTTTTKSKSYSLFAHERKSPPRALMFGRTDGLTWEKLGNYEPEYLNSFELKTWNYKCKIKEARKKKNEIKKERKRLREKTTKISEVEKIMSEREQNFKKWHDIYRKKDKI